MRFLASAVVLALALPSLASCITFVPDVRPPYADRKFHSSAIDDFIASSLPKFSDPQLATLFQNTFPNTLDTTVYQAVPGDSFIITGDIDAMWLRDSCNQVLPYVPFAASDPSLSSLLQGIVLRMSRSVLLDPYANAFNLNGTLPLGAQSDIRTPPMTWPVFEGKYELDSLAAFLKLSRSVYAVAPEMLSDDDNLATWLAAVDAVVSTITEQQKSTDEDSDLLDSGHPAFLFKRSTTQASDTLIQDGRGSPNSKTGMSRCSFRPSDDAVVLPFLVPANAMAVVELRKVAEVVGDVEKNRAGGNNGGAKSFGKAKRNGSRLVELEATLRRLANEIDAGIQNFGRGVNSVTGDVTYFYEVDGFGNMLFMDDANIPGLLSLPYLGYVDKTDSVYLATRKAVLSRSTNPYFFKGLAGEGVGGPHAGYGMIWPMSIMIRALTSTSDDEIKDCLDTLVKSSAGKGFMHESFWKNDVGNFSRPWFAWANSLFGELIITLMEERPYLILKQ